MLTADFIERSLLTRWACAVVATIIDRTGVRVEIISFFRILFVLDGMEPVTLNVAPNADLVITGAVIVSLGFGLAFSHLARR
jgi:hypothetical protein